MNQTHLAESCECEPALQIRGLGVNYGGQVALKDVSLTIEAGSITAIIGPSGCGKSSFLACLNRMTDLTAHCATTGSVELDGVDILGDAFRKPAQAAALRRCVGMIFQKPNPFPLTIAENIELGLKEHGVKDKAERRQKATAALQAVGLWDEVQHRLNESALTLSGGQQQRLCIARAIALEPKILLMDEPCSALDPIASQRVEQLIAELRGRYTVVLVTHNLAQARRVADQTALFWNHGNGGELVEVAATSLLFNQPREAITKAYVGGECC